MWKFATGYQSIVGVLAMINARKNIIAKRAVQAQKNPSLPIIRTGEGREQRPHQ